jgi:putative transposase
LEIRQRRLSRKKNGSKNRAKARQRVARLQQKVRCVRSDYQWKLAKRIAASADLIGFEDLNTKGMQGRCKPKKDPETPKGCRGGASRRKIRKLASTSKTGKRQNLL